MSGRNIIVTGSTGQLGSELKDISSKYPQFQFRFFDSAGFPVQDEKLARNIFEQYDPFCLINAAAYTQVDKAESETEPANHINGYAVGSLASLCREFNARFIHMSTDYVFNGRSATPLKEDDPADPVNAYGFSKLLGEQLAMENNPSSVIIRTSWVYSHHGKNFVKTMIRLMKEKESISVVDDQAGSPTYAADLAGAIMQIAAYDEWFPGFYHYSNEGKISWFDFAGEIKKQTGSSCIVHPIHSAQYPTPAKRPGYSVMDTGKIQKTYGIEIKDWKQSLKECIDKMKNLDS